MKKERIDTDNMLARMLGSATEEMKDEQENKPAPEPVQETPKKTLKGRPKRKITVTTNTVQFNEENMLFAQLLSKSLKKEGLTDGTLSSLVNHLLEAEKEKKPKIAKMAKELWKE